MTTKVGNEDEALGKEQERKISKKKSEKVKHKTT